MTWQVSILQMLGGDWKDHRGQGTLAAKIWLVYCFHPSSILLVSSLYTTCILLLSWKHPLSMLGMLSMLSMLSMTMPLSF